MLRCHFFFAITLTHIMDQLGIRDTSFHQLHNVSLFLFLHRSLSVRSTTRRSVDVYPIRIDLYERSTGAWILYDFSFNFWSTLFKKIGASGDEGWQMVKAEGKLSHWFVRKRRVKFHAGRVANVLRKIFSHVFIAACDLWLFLIVIQSVYTRYVNLNEIYMGDRIAGSTIWYAFLFYRWLHVPTKGEKSFQTWGLKL